MSQLVFFYQTERSFYLLAGERLVASSLEYDRLDLLLVDVFIFNH